MPSLIEEIAQIKSHLKAQDRDPIHRLRDCLNDQSPIDEFPGVQTLVSRVTARFMKLGWPPLRVQASYFSQNGSRSPFEVSWLRNDLMTASAAGSRTTTSHGPAFRLVISDPDIVEVKMSSRHSIEARSVFIKNVLSTTSSRWIEHCLGELRRDRVVVKWTDEWYRVEGIEDLRELAADVARSKTHESMKYSYFSATKQLGIAHLRDETRVPSMIVRFFARAAPLFWGHHIMLEPKAARTQRQTKHQISREQLRKDVLRLEDRCQNADCPLDGGDPRMLKVAHLTPKLNLLSNVIVLCSLCYDEQFPATSVIRIRSECTSPDPDRLAYSVELETRDGPKTWNVATAIDHPLSNPRAR